MTNNEFLDRVKSILQERDLSLYELQKMTDESVIKESTFYSMFKKKSAARIEYICEISKVLGMSPAEMVDAENNKEYLTPIEIEILDAFEGLDEDTIRRVLLIQKGVIAAEKAKNTD